MRLTAGAGGQSRRGLADGPVQARRPALLLEGTANDARRLRPAFVAVRNGDERGLDTVRKGNEAVLAARLADAQFYWETDLKKSPAEQIEAELQRELDGAE